MLNVSDIQAMVLAAGLGTRLKPYSLVRPKPLFPVLDQPLLARTIQQLNKSGFTRLTVNAHHLREQFASFFNDSEGVNLQLEETILGTGGGLRLASSGFGKSPVLVTNGDIFHSIDLAWVYEQHLRSKAKITLVMHDFPRFNNVLVNKAGNVLAFGSQNRPDICADTRMLAFTGIHVIAPEILRTMPPGTFYDIIDCYRTFIQQGGTINGLVVTDHFWTDMGTIPDYLALHGKLLHEFAATGDLPFYFGANVRRGHNLQLQDWVSIGSNTTVGDNVSLERVVVWDGVAIPGGSILCDTVIF